MSKIGDHIHLRIDTYLELNRAKPYNNATLFSNYKDAKKAAKDHFLDVGGNIEAAQKLENALNILFPTDSESLDKIDESQELRYSILQDVANKLDRAPKVIKQILNDSIESGVLLATGDSEEEQAIATASSKRRKTLTEIRSILQDMKTRIKEEDRNRLGWRRDVIDILNGIKRVEKVPDSTDENKKKQVDKINKCLEEAQTEIASLLKSPNWDLSEYKSKYAFAVSQDERVQNKSLTISKKNEESVDVYIISLSNVEAATDAISNALNAEAIIKKDIGDGAEYTLGAVGRACNLDKNGKAKKAMGEYVFGDARTSIYFDLDLFNSKLTFLEKARSKPSSKGTTKALYTAIKETIEGVETTKGYKSTSASQDKIDVVYKGEDVKAIFKKAKQKISSKEKSMTFSVKNYTQGSAFGGVSGTSFLSLVQSINADFVNHWINLTIGHQEKDNPPSWNLVSDVKGYKKEVDEAHLIMQRYLIKIGAAGGALKLSKSEKKARFIDKAQYIVWNDRSGRTQGKVTWHVYPTKQILRGIKKMANLDEYIKGYEVFKDKKKWITEKENGQQSDIKNLVQQRIDNVLKFMWEQKISTETPAEKALEALSEK